MSQELRDRLDAAIDAWAEQGRRMWTDEKGVTHLTLGPNHYAADALRAEMHAAIARRLAGEGWMPIETAPKDGTTHLRGLWVMSNRGGVPIGRAWRQYLGYLDEERGFVDPEYQEGFGWEADDFELWAPIPASPTQDAAHGGRDDG